jgi:MFS family permease
MDRIGCLIDLSQEQKREKQGPRLNRVFSFAVTATFALELFSVLIVIGSVTAFIVSNSGLLHVLTLDVQVLLFLIASGIAFLILIIFAGFFIKGNERLQEKILTSKIGQLTRATSEAKALLALFGLALIFLCSAGIYGYYLLWAYFLGPAVGVFLSLTMLAFAAGIFLVSLLAQIVIALVGRFALRAIRTTQR